MASSVVKSAGAGRYDRYHKYESMRIEWTKHTSTASAFFQNFHRSHPGFQFAIAELFDGTTHILVSAEKYDVIKDELEKKTGRTLPDVSNVSDVKIKEERKSFPNSQSHRDFSMSLKAGNDRIKAR